MPIFLQISLSSGQAFSTINNHTPLPTGYIDWGYLDLNLNAVSKSIDFEINPCYQIIMRFLVPTSPCHPIFSRIIRVRGYYFILFVYNWESRIVMFDDLHKLADKNLNNPSHAYCCNKDTYILCFYIYSYQSNSSCSSSFLLFIFFISIDARGWECYTPTESDFSAPSSSLFISILVLTIIHLHLHHFPCLSMLQFYMFGFAYIERWYLTNNITRELTRHLFQPFLNV